MLRLARKNDGVMDDKNDDDDTGEVRSALVIASRAPRGTISENHSSTKPAAVSGFSSPADIDRPSRPRAVLSRILVSLISLRATSTEKVQ